MINTTLFTQIGLDSGALTQLGSWCTVPRARRVPRRGRAGSGKRGSFRLRVDEEDPRCR